MDLKACFIRRISVTSNAIQTIVNELRHFIIYCLNYIRRDYDATYKTGLQSWTKYVAKYHFNSPPQISMLIVSKEMFLSNIDIRGRITMHKICYKVDMCVNQ